MNQMRFIIGIQEGYRIFLKEIAIAETRPFPGYDRFLKAMGFWQLVERIVSACVIYPRSADISHEELVNLSHGISMDLGIAERRLSNMELDSLANLVVNIGDIIFSQLEGAGYYVPINSIPRHLQDDEGYLTELTAFAKTNRIGLYSFEVVVREQLLSDIEPSDFDFEQDNTLSTRQSYTRSLQ